MPLVPSSSHGVPAMVRLATVTLGVDTASIDFPGIAQTYQRLLVIARLRTDEAATQRSAVDLAFNADVTAGHYSNGRLYSLTGAVVGGDGNIGSRQLAFAVGDAGVANAYGTALLLVGGYADANLKQAFVMYGNLSTLATPDYVMGMNVLSWNSTAAVTQLTLAPSTGGAKFRAGSVATLYGLSA